MKTVSTDDVARVAHDLKWQEREWTLRYMENNPRDIERVKMCEMIIEGITRMQDALLRMAGE